MFLLSKVKLHRLPHSYAVKICKTINHTIHIKTPMPTGALCNLFDGLGGKGFSTVPTYNSSDTFSIKTEPGGNDRTSVATSFP